MQTTLTRYLVALQAALALTLAQATLRLIARKNTQRCKA